MDKNEGSGELAVLWLLRTGLRELASFLHYHPILSVFVHRLCRGWNVGLGESCSSVRS